MHLALFAAALLTQPVPNLPATDNAPPPTEVAPAGDEIVVTGRRESTLDLDRLERARATYQKYRAAYASSSTLYFELQPSSRVNLTGLKLTLRAADQSVDVPIDAEHRFVLPALAKGSWELFHNGGRGQISIRPLVLSPGATEIDRPLGDLRLQCRVGRFLNGTTMSLRDRFLFDVVGACTSKRVAMHFFSKRPLKAASVTYGANVRALGLDTNSRRYLVPTSDQSLPNVARVRLTYRN